MKLQGFKFVLAHSKNPLSFCKKGSKSTPSKRVLLLEPPILLVSSSLIVSKMDYLWHELMLHHYTLYVNRFLKKPGKFSSKALPRHLPKPAAALCLSGHEFIRACRWARCPPSHLHRKFHFKEQRYFSTVSTISFADSICSFASSMEIT